MVYILHWMGSGGNYLAFVSPAPRCSAEKPLQVRDKAKSKRKVRVHMEREERVRRARAREQRTA